MESFTEDHSKELLDKAWLVKVDASESIPYLFKFHASKVDSMCWLMITDTKRVWAEVLSSKRLLRRSLACNPSLVDDSSLSQTADHQESMMNLLDVVHSIGGISDVSFEVVQSRDADHAFELDCDGFKWRWETYLLGPKTSADIISKHLIMPLISVTHMAFYSADPVSELAETDLETVVDKIGRSGRRTVDIHVKHAISKPRVATTLQRMTAMFNFNPSLPSIQSNVEKPDVEALVSEMRSMSQRPSMVPHGDDRTRDFDNFKAKSKHTPSASTSSPRRSSPIPTKSEPASDSATEQETDEDLPPAAAVRNRTQRSTSPRVDSFAASHRRKSHLVVPQNRPASAEDANSSSDSSPKIPAKKKLKSIQVDSDSDNDEGNGMARNRGTSRAPPSEAADAPGARRGGVVTRGVRQPLKRGGKRF